MGHGSGNIGKDPYQFRLGGKGGGEYGGGGRVGDSRGGVEQRWMSQAEKVVVAGRIREGGETS